MDFVIAVKSEPNRKARVTATNRVTLLLSSSSEVTDTTILHRDAVYNSKLQGTCFSCSKLNANPPADVCVTPDGGGGGGDSCSNFDDPCSCLTCPPPPDDRECSCGNGGYPAPNTPGLGSGYWAGIQANTHYSNVPNGGWVVAVACGSSEVIGAFPVTGNKFGYGRGTVMGLPAMIYPAGALYGAGYRPVNETSFPILALVPADGNYLINIGDFGPRATGSTIPGCPSESSNEQYYCTAANSTVYVGKPRACIAKYNGNDTSPCPVFANYVAFAEGIEDDTEYSMNMAGVLGFPFGPNTGPGAILFQDDNSNQYCGTVDTLVPKPSDAAGGSCGGTIFPDTPISFSDDCISCDQKVPCEYVANLTNGSINIDYGGFNAAGPSGFQAIGPAFPPVSDGSGGFTNTSYWEDFWRWTPTIQSYIPISNPDNPISVIIPPITGLEDNCTCSIGESNNSSIVIIEAFPCCDESGTFIGPPIAPIIKRSMSPGLSGCGISCPPPCVNPNCSCVGTTGALGPVGIYGYTPCRLCECAADGKNGAPIEEFESQPTSIWWASGIEQHNQVVYNSQTQLEAPNCINTCSSVMSNKGNYCGSPCGKLFRSVTTVINGVPIKTIELDLDNFKLCTGFDDPQQMLDDPCGLSKFLPAEFHNESLTYQPTLVDSASNPYSLANYIATDDTAQPYLGLLLGDGTNPDFYLNHSSGPFGIAYANDINDPETTDRDCYNPFVSSFIVCAIPKLKEVRFIDCASECVTVEKVVFDEVKNEMCEDVVTNQILGSDVEAVQDPCACCGKNLIENELSCSGEDCPPCCSNGGCVTGNCEPTGVFIDPNNCGPGPGLPHQC
jgi:hypothetical protein